MEEQYTIQEKMDFLTKFLDDEEKTELNSYVKEVSRILNMALERAENAVRELSCKSIKEYS